MGSIGMLSFVVATCLASTSPWHKRGYPFIWQAILRSLLPYPKLVTNPPLEAVMGSFIPISLIWGCVLLSRLVGDLVTRMVTSIASRKCTACSIVADPWLGSIGVGFAGSTP